MALQATNAIGLSSTNLELTICQQNTDQPNMLSIQKTSQECQIIVAGLGGREYQVERAPTVTGPWTALTPSIFMPTLGVATITNTPPDNGSYFYRAMLVQKNQ